MSGLTGLDGKVDRTELNARARRALSNPTQKVTHGH